MEKYVTLTYKEEEVVHFYGGTSTAVGTGAVVAAIADAVFVRGRGGLVEEGRRNNIKYFILTQLWGRLNSGREKAQ